MRIRGFAYFVFLFCAGWFFAEDGFASVSEDLTNRLQSKAKLFDSGVSVIRLSDGEEIFSYNGSKLLSPASIIKLVPAAASLHHFGATHRFHTKIYLSGIRRGGKVNGNLVIVGDGDPFLVSEKLWQFAADLRNMGIKTIMGDIVVDGSLFDGEDFDPSRQHALSRSVNAYDAPITALAVNFNTVTIAAAPGEKIGSPAHVGLDPYPIRNFKVLNSAKTVAAKNKTHLYASRNNGSQKSDASIRVSGNVSSSDYLEKLPRSIHDPLFTAGEYFRAFLDKEGISVSGKTRMGVLAKEKNHRLLYEIEGYPMSKLIEGLNKFSNNFIADVLTKRLGAAFPISGAADAPGSGSYTNGIQVLNSFLKKTVGIKDSFTITNGSGLDVKNRMSARQLSLLLSFIEKSMDLFPDFIASLPVAGSDGTLKKRFLKQDALLGVVRAKTGSLTEPISVASLAGYFRHPRYGLCAFAVIQNGLNQKPQPGIESLKDLQDQMLESMLNL